MYHSVDVYQEDPNQVTVTPGQFARQMQWLRHRGLRGVAMSELLRAHATGSTAGLVGLTFDDGYADLTSQVLPVLERCGFTATAFVLAGCLGGRNSWDGDGPDKLLLTLDQLRQLDGSSLEIGSHGMLHRNLVGLNAHDLETETQHSREILQDILQRPVNGFCYPYGALDAPAVASVRNSGYDYAVAIGHGSLTGRWALPRSFVGERDTGWRLAAKRARHLLRGLDASRNEIQK
jgi:peptidoglycan/xylan/chitin deacetylase (PgdA/CDA1 family)